jgi:hypothetical protein
MRIKNSANTKSVKFFYLIGEINSFYIMITGSKFSTAINKLINLYGKILDGINTLWLILNSVNKIINL